MTTTAQSKYPWLLLFAVVLGDGAFVVLQVPSPSFNAFGLTPFPFLIIETLTYFFAGYLLYRLRVYNSQHIYLVSCIICVTSALLLFFEVASPEVSIIFQCLVYVSLALLNLCWGVCFASFKPSLSISLVAGAYTLWGIFSLVLSQITGTPWGNFLQVALPLLSVFLLGFCLRNFNFGQNQKQFAPEETLPRSFHLSPFAKTAFFMSLALSFIFGCLMQVDSMLDIPDYIVSPSTHILMILLSLAIFFLSLKRKPDTAYKALIVAFIALVTFLLLRILFVDQLPFVSGLPTVLFNFFGLFVWVIFAWEGYENKIGSLTIFALGLGSLRLGLLGGRSLVLAVSEFTDISASTAHAFSVVCLWLLFIGSMLVVFFVVRRQNIETFYMTESPEDDASFDNVSPQDTHTSYEDIFLEAVNPYGLTERERQILLMYTQGRSAPYIAENLVLSNYTVKTHIRRGFSKLDIHSRQELLDLVWGKTQKQ